MDWNSHGLRMSGSRSRGFSLEPLGMVAALAVTLGVTTYLVWPPRRASLRARRHGALVTYLLDHLSGSEVAVRVVRRLNVTLDEPEDRALFHRLATELDEDRAVVTTLLAQLGASARSIKRAAGAAFGEVLSLTAGGEPGDLSLLRTLEALAIGVQGKRCLWRALQNVRMPAGVHRMNFVELEAKAVRQWEALEERRRIVVKTTLSAGH